MVAVDDERLDAGAGKPLHPISQPKLRPETPILAVINVPGYEKKVGLALPGDVDEPVEGAKCGRVESLSYRRSIRRHPTKGTVDVQVGSMNKREGAHGVASDARILALNDRKFSSAELILAGGTGDCNSLADQSDSPPRSTTADLRRG